MLENLLYVAEVWGVPPGARRQRITRLLEFSRLGAVPGSPDAQPLRRHEAEAEPRGLPHPPAAHPAARRADHRRRPAVAPRLLADPLRPAAGGLDDPAVDAVHGRGRALRPRRLPARRPRDRLRHARRSSRPSSASRVLELRCAEPRARAARACASVPGFEHTVLFGERLHVTLPRDGFDPVERRRSACAPPASTIDEWRGARAVARGRLPRLHAPPTGSGAGPAERTAARDRSMHRMTALAVEVDGPHPRLRRLRRRRPHRPARREPARSSASSVPTAPASRRPSACSAASCARPPGARTVGGFDIARADRAREEQHRLHVAEVLALRGPHGRGEPAASSPASTACAARSATARIAWALEMAGLRGPRAAADRRARRRLAPAPGARLRRAARAADPLPRRADLRRRPGLAPRLLGDDRRARRARHHRLRHHALHGRGRALRRAGAHLRRQDRRRRQPVGT